MSAVFTDPNSPLLNRAVGSAFPPGSVFKLVASAAGLETNKLNLDTQFFCPGSTVIGKREFKCWGVHNEENLIEAIAHSCDVFFYRTGLLLGPQSIHDYAVKFGLGRISGIELPYETQGFIPNPFWKRITKFQRWYDGDTANFVIGQGDVLTSPLQVTRLTAIFANGGRLVTPYIIKTVDGSDVSTAHSRLVDLRLKEKTVKNVLEGLREVVRYTDGTAHVLSSLPVSVAGKTGTAQASGNKDHAWFSGFFPFEKPRYVITVFLEKGGHGTESSLVTKGIIERMFSEGLI
jgi:penicillin-binding protein 2